MSWLAFTENSGQASHQRSQNKSFHMVLCIFKVFYNVVRGAHKQRQCNFDSYLFYQFF